MTDTIAKGGNPSGVGLSEVAQARSSPYPAPRAVLELLKPITWFAPMWAFMCGVVSSGVPILENWHILFGGVILAGPLVCAMSQAINDWHDRHVDAINEPDRPIPSGRIPGRWGLYIAILWSGLSIVWASLLGPWVASATVLGLLLAWAYSAPPLRLKENGWLGNAACGLCYEGLAWFTGAAVLLGALPNGEIIAMALLYSVGAHGIMTLNDFKSLEGDRQMGVGTLPVRLGIHPAARLACLVMTLPQCIVIALLWMWGAPIHAAFVAFVLLVQIGLMVRFLLNRSDLEAHPWRNAALYNATGTTAYVIGMLISAFALRSI